ncbi:MAG: NADH-quinone oxidoreductase subunit NuoE [Desulfobacterales bacterium]|nr:MAG: NADH-quinone oxidoreductase subunit NuoE [Desulfobacterales bacterium]
MTQEENLDLQPLEDILAEYRGQKGAVIPVLQKAQKIYGYLPAQVLRRIAKGMRVPLSRLYGVATFYSQFYLTRRGRHVLRQCDGTACHVRGAAKIIERMENELGIKAGETTPDYKLTCEVVYCLGSCGLAPVAVVDDTAVGKLVPEKMMAIIRNLN